MNQPRHQPNSARRRKPRTVRTVETAHRTTSTARHAVASSPGMGLSTIRSPELPEELVGTYYLG